MFRKKKSKAQLAQSSTTAASEPNTGEKQKKKGGKNKKKKSKGKSNKNINPNAILPKNKGNKGNKAKKKKKNTKKAKTQTNIKLNDTKGKKKKNSAKSKDNARGRARTTVDKKPKQSKPKYKIKPKEKTRSKSKGPSSKSSKTTNNNNIELNSISYSPSKPEPEQKEPTPSKPKKKRFPWANWAIDRGDESEADDDGPTHRQRRSSLGSVREFHIARAKRARIKTVVKPTKPKPAPNNRTVIIKDDELNEINSSISGKKGGGHRKKKKKSKKKKMDKWDKISSNTADRHNTDGVDIYDPQAKKNKRRKDKEQQKFKIVPKHHVKRSSLPTYQSIRKNNPQLKFYVHKETQRNLASLLDQPEKRKKSKRLRNLSRKGFDIHVNHRYRLEDGRVGVCKYKGRTEFGKSSEDWIGLVLDIGEGEHDGSVQGKSYFRCRDGKGLFVRPFDIIQDMGSKNKLLTKQDIKLAKQHIKRYKKIESGGVTTSEDMVKKDKDGNAINPDHGYDMLNEKFYNPKTLLDKNKGKKAKKKKHHTQI